jgi:quercetin dioxygenase-like cupin family protein
MSGFTIFDAYKTLTSPISLNDEADLSALIHQNPSTPSQPPPPGTTTASTAAAAAPDTENGAIWFPAGDPTQTLFRYCDWAPGASSVDHRTETLDIGVVVAGQMEARLDSGEVRTLNVGDTIVQRGTMHSWRNPSDTEWARMVVFLVGVEDVSVGGVKLGGAMG